MSAGDMIPHCCICHRRHYGADCPDLPHHTVPVTNASSDVVERLRHIVRRERRLISSVVALPQEDCATLTEAIATIERLSAELERVKHARQMMLSRLRDGPGDYNKGFDNGVYAAVAMFDAALSNAAEVKS